MAEREKGPRDLDKRPPSRSKNAPDHLRLGKGRGVRTTAQTMVERIHSAHEQAKSEKYEEGRTTGAGPNPYKLPKAKSAYEEACSESAAADAEVQVPGNTLTDTGLKIVLDPERLASDEKAVLPRAGTPHEEAVATLEEEPEEPVEEEEKPAG